MWWPGTELNRRRQPFQGCALPPELPGHVLTYDFPAGLNTLGCRGSAIRKAVKTLGAFETSDYSNQLRFPQSWHCATCSVPFNTVMAHRFEANQYGISR